MGADRQRTSGSEFGHECPFDRDLVARFDMVDRLQRLEDLTVPTIAFHRNAPLANSGHELCRIEYFGNAVGEVQHLQRRHGHDDGTPDGHTFESRVDVAAQLFEHEVGPCPPELGSAPHRASGDRCFGREVRQAKADQGVGGVTTLGERSDHEALGRRRREILGRVHRHVCTSVEYSELHLFGEHTLAANGVQRHVRRLSAITERVDDEEFRWDARCNEPVGDRERLGGGLLATTCGNAERLGGSHRPSTSD